jgi:hypothetical protein
MGQRSAGEGPGRPARVHVSEESHRGVVARNHSNQDGTSLAESEEGRLRIKENTCLSSTYPTQSGSARVPRIGESADKLYARLIFIRDRHLPLSAWSLRSIRLRPLHHCGPMAGVCAWSGSLFVVRPILFGRIPGGLLARVSSRSHSRTPTTRAFPRLCGVSLIG